MEHAELTPFLALYFDDNQPTLTIRPQDGPSDPRLVGIALADVVTAIAKSFVDMELQYDNRTMTYNEIRAEIVEWFQKELDSPTDDIKIEVMS